jgi:iron(III) transport system permease protein
MTGRRSAVVAPCRTTRPLNVETLSTYIYQFATRGSFEEGALAALLIVAAGILSIIWIVRQAEMIPVTRSSAT